MQMHIFDLFFGGNYRYLDNNGKMIRNPNALASVNNLMQLKNIGFVDKLKRNHIPESGVITCVYDFWHFKHRP
jgi:hypothetical protein